MDADVIFGTIEVVSAKNNLQDGCNEKIYFHIIFIYIYFLI